MKALHHSHGKCRLDLLPADIEPYLLAAHRGAQWLTWLEACDWWTGARTRSIAAIAASYIVSLDDQHEFGGIGAVAEVLAYGQQKYPHPPHNWYLGHNWSEFWGSVRRHHAANDQQEGCQDHESELPHVWHAACDLMFLACYSLHGVGVDDRPPPFGPRS